MTLLIIGDDTMNTIFGNSDDKGTSVIGFGDDTIMTYYILVLVPTINAMHW